MRDKKHHPNYLITLILSLLLFVTAARTLAQETTPPYLVITGSQVSSPPLIDLHVYGLDAAGSPLNLAEQTLSIKHNGVPVGPAEVTSSATGGTFTAFLIDIPLGVADQLPAIQEAIKQYASAPTMVETTDAVAVYKVGAAEAVQLLPPETFYNSVRNLFAAPLEPETGATALVDSLGGLLEQVESLKLRPEMTPAIVVITDGTDVVSARYDENEIAKKAADLGIPIHTIWLTNENLSPASQQFGQDYLTAVAAGSRGLTARLQDTADLIAIWNRIASFREQTIISYRVDDLTSGDYPVELSLDGSLVVRVETMVTVPANLPQIAINLPPESRELALPNLDKPVKLRFSTTLNWLDGEERNVAAAQLLINGTAYDVPVTEIAQFDVDVNNLAYQANTVQLAVLDTQGLRVTSPPIELMVTEGAKSIPPELQSSGSFLGIAGRILLLLLAVVGLGIVVVYAGRQGWLSNVSAALPRGPSRRKRPAQAAPATKPVIETVSTHAIARLEVLETVTRTQPEFGLGQAVVKIGRSPAQSNIAFENDITVSRLHASLHLEGNHYRIFDERSASGVWVNDQQVPEYGIQLMDGDEIHLGAVHLRFRQP